MGIINQVFKPNLVQIHTRLSTIHSELWQRSLVYM